MMFSIVAPLAGANLYVCDSSCTNVGALAATKARTMASGARFTVIDVLREEAASYEVRQLRAGWTWISVPSEIALDPAHRQNFEALLAAKGDFEAATRGFELPKSLADSAWDLSGNSQVRNRIIDHINEESHIGDDIAAMIGFGMEAFGDVVGTKLEYQILVHFSDGSTAVLNITGRLHGDLQMTFDTSHLRDADDNSVATEYESFSGFYGFSNERNLNQFLQAVSRNSIEIREYARCRAQITVTCERTSGGRVICHMWRIEC